MLQLTVNAGFKEMGIQELDNMWQNGFSKAFNEWSPSFSTDGWFAAQTPIPITLIESSFENYYLE